MVFAAIDHPAIACQDVQKQIDWYCKNLDMRLISSDGKTPPVGALVGYEGSGVTIELMLARDAGPGRGKLCEISARLAPIWRCG